MVSDKTEGIGYLLGVTIQKETGVLQDGQAPGFFYSMKKATQRSSMLTDEIAQLAEPACHFLQQLDCICIAQVICNTPECKLAYLTKGQHPLIKTITTRCWLDVLSAISPHDYIIRNQELNNFRPNTAQILKLF